MEGAWFLQGRVQRAMRELTLSNRNGAVAAGVAGGLALLAGIVLCMAGCFVFDNPYDIPTPAVTFQVVMTGPSYGGTYVWSPSDSAYTTLRGGTPYYLYLYSTGYWCISPSTSTPPGAANCRSDTILFAPLPTTNSIYWSPGGEITNVDDSEGGACRTMVAPDSPAANGQLLQVVFRASSPGNTATYQWMRSNTPTGGSPIPGATGSTYFLTSLDMSKWISVIVTPSDPTGFVQGTPAVSPPIHVAP